MQQDQEKREIRIIDVLEFLIRSAPGRTQRQLAQAIFGDNGYQQRVNQDCSLLVNVGRAECRGTGNSGEPFTYWPAR